MFSGDDSKKVNKNNEITRRGTPINEMKDMPAPVMGVSDGGGKKQTDAKKKPAIKKAMSGINSVTLPRQTRDHVNYLA